MPRNTVSELNEVSHDNRPVKGLIGSLLALEKCNPGDYLMILDDSVNLGRGAVAGFSALVINKDGQITGGCIVYGNEKATYLGEAKVLIDKIYENILVPVE